MDLLLINSETGAKIHPMSVHGILWLQTHFEDQNWESLAASAVQIPFRDAEELYKDAQEAGLILNFVPAVPVVERF